jgi:hypothetical protein
VRDDDFAKLRADCERELIKGARHMGILGLTSVAVRLVDCLAGSGLISTVGGIFSHAAEHPSVTLRVPVAPMKDLERATFDVLVVASDEDKQEVLLAALPYIQGTPKVVVAGYGHLTFRDPVYNEELAQLLVPSLANGYPHSLPHLYQCLVNSSRLGLRGVVVEFGMYKGGTTMFLSRTIERLGEQWPVIGFDTFSGFPPRRSPLDMYDHPDCVFTNLEAVRRYLAGRNIEVVAGDIVTTVVRLATEDVVLSFVDTDNYSSARAALDVVRERTVVGGAIVLDHFTGDNRFRYTIGERIAGLPLLDDSRYFHLYGTGVFYRQR